MSDLAAVLARLDKIEKGPWRIGEKDGPYWQYLDAPGHEQLAKFVVRMMHFKPDQAEPGIAHNMFAASLLPELIAVAKAAAELRWLQAQPITATQALHKAGPALDAALSALANRGME